MSAEKETIEPESGKKKLTLEEIIARGKMAEQADTFQGQLLASLKENAGETEVVEWERRPYGRDAFHYGDDQARIQWHSEGGTMKDYARMLDLQKKWWRETYFEGKCGGDLDRIGLIAPTLSELLSFYAPDQAESFALNRLLEDAGKSAGSVSAEYTESDIHAETNTDNPGRVATDLIAEFLSGIVPSEFAVEFSNGGGDTMLSLRIVPKTKDAQLAVINGGKPIEDAVEAILSNRAELVDFLRTSL